MKKVLFSAVALLAFGFANAQEEEKGNGGFAKGSIFMSGTVGLSSEKQDDVKVRRLHHLISLDQQIHAHQNARL